MNDDKELNDLLMKRIVPAPSSNLAHRICSSAGNVSEHFVHRGFLYDLRMMFAIPRPAYVLALCLIIGLMLGTQIDMEMSEFSESWESLTVLEEGEWL